MLQSSIVSEAGGGGGLEGEGGAANVLVRVMIGLWGTPLRQIVCFVFEGEGAE